MITAIEPLDAYNLQALRLYKTELKTQTNDKARLVWFKSASSNL